MKPDLISCMIPVFNGERYLGEALDSILRQTYRPLEIIVVDDGSTDGTADVVAGYGEQVRYLWQSRAGPAAARNLGLSVAQGAFVAFLDADDLWHPDKLARQMARFHARPELDLCVTHIQNFWIPELHEEEERFRNHRLSRPMPGYLPQTCLARRGLFETVGHFDDALNHASEFDWFVQATEQGIVMELLTDVLVYRRLHHSNYSRLQAVTSRHEYLEVLKASLDRRRRRDGAVPRSHECAQLDRQED